MDENGILGVRNDKWVTCGMVILPMVLAHGFQVVNHYKRRAWAGV